jgi:hypothetical protein
MSVKTTIGRPSGFLPLAMSGAALIVVLLRLALFGAAPESVAGRSDEGPAAHLWQIFMIGQIPIILFFAIRWRRNDPRGAMSVLGLQLLAIAAAMAPIYLLKW